MATRPIVPRANGEGSLGVSTKSWGGVFTNELNGANAVDMADFSKATLRQPSTAYTTGAMAYHATLPAGWYLECTTAGTTGSGTLTITSPTVGGTVSDGTVTWTIKSLNKSLFNINDGILSDCNDAVNNGLYSFDTNTANKPGYSGVLLSMEKADRCGQLAFNLDGVGMNQYHMRTGYGLASEHPQYTDWQRIDTVVAESLVATDQQYATTGYRKYASGLIEQWGLWYSNLQTGTIVFPISFPNKCTSINVSMLVGEGDMQTVCVGALDKTSFTFKKSIAGNGLAWCAVGY